MSLPAPSLDDRRFQDLVDEAKRMIPQLCPEWTDHNVSDPGVALLEIFAWMTEQTLYRLNRVPDRLYVKFLELVGIELMSASPARTDLVFELSAPPVDPVRVGASTQVATDGEEPVVFMTDRPLVMVSPEAAGCVTVTANGTAKDESDRMKVTGQRITAFPSDGAGSPQPGAAFYLGCTRSCASQLLRLRTTSSAEGAGIRPDAPPWQWQVWNGRDWEPVRVLRDTTGGFTEPGELLMLVPPRHEQMSPTGGRLGWWLRCILVEPGPRDAPYDRSPQITALELTGTGGAVSARHAEPLPAELVGRSDGKPGQEFMVRRAPVLARSATEHVRVLLPRHSAGAGSRTGGGTGGGTGAEQVWQDWSEVQDFADAGPNERIYTWSGATGEIRFGPLVRRRRRSEDGATIDDLARQHGAVPPIDAQVWVTGYRVGGGARGNVGAGTLVVPRTSVPGLDRVYNLDSATGGVDPETIENAKVRGPMELRSNQRAVTRQDFERLVASVSRQVARVRCTPDPQRPHVVRLGVVPGSNVPPSALDVADLALPVELAELIRDRVDQHRLLTVNVELGPAEYRGVSVAAAVRAAAGMHVQTAKADGEEALYRFVNPLTGGVDGRGWPFGEPLTLGAVYAVLQSVPSIASVERVVLFGADLDQPPGPGRVSSQSAGNSVAPPEGGLLLSCSHVVEVIG